MALKPNHLKRLVLLPILLLLLTTHINAQTQAYGVVDTADLKMTSCNFEKDANAMVLFDRAEVSYKYTTVIMERHKRIKIFNNDGKDAANIRLEYFGVHNDEEIVDLEAETINLEGKSMVYTAIDKKSVYKQPIDKMRQALVFTFPNVRPGSVIEFRYKLTTPYPYNYPDWFFQTSIPTRYSEFDASFVYDYKFNFFKKVYQRMAKDTAMERKSPEGIRHIWALSNVKAYKVEPYMDYPQDYLQCILLKILHPNRTWINVGNDMLADEDFGDQLKVALDREDGIIAKANKLKTDNEKMAFIFDTVKKVMKWNKVDLWYTNDGVKKAWNKKTGNSTEINLILYHLLRTANLTAYLMPLKTRDEGRLDVEYPSLTQLNKTVVYCPVDSANYYVLDASNQYNSYNTIPFDLIGLDALSFGSDGKDFKLFPLKNGTARDIILVNGSINAGGKLEGSTQISSLNYSHGKYLKKYNDLGEKEYINQTQTEHAGLKINNLKLEGKENDTIPLIQKFDFTYNLTAPDEGYMYFNPNIFGGFRENPFLSETRVSNIDLGCLYNYSINGRYKIPPGYKTEALPAGKSLAMPDTSIIFKRAVAEQDGDVIIHYTINYKRSAFDADEYKSLRDFYKKMFELLNEQIVLKKI